MDYVNPSVGSCNRNDKMFGGMNEPVGYTVVLVSSNRQIRDVFEALRNRLADMRIVGDASSPRYVQTAICEGHLAGAAVRLTWRDARCQARKQ